MAPMLAAIPLTSGGIALLSVTCCKMLCTRSRPHAACAAIANTHAAVLYQIMQRLTAAMVPTGVRSATPKDCHGSLTPAPPVRSPP